jgi:hypothetical protein
MPTPIKADENLAQIFGYSALGRGLIIDQS